ncbi:sulfotransferase family protein [Catenovulum sp. SX2]|uniref:sulfotransferase family protein n=1 Tax=Catenovulum sp. SX2 TaxID=3398614 RepID=UPI003F837703
MDLGIANWPVFIMGTQRSGTTLLTRVLSAHPDIFMQNELELPRVFKGEQEPKNITQNILEEIKQEHKVDISEYLNAPGKLWGLKDPQLTEHIPTLQKFLPHSKFIIIVRDGRGVTNSYMENKWGLGTNAYTGAHRWKNEVNQQLEFMASAPDNFLFIRYEDMIADLEATMHKVCLHLEIDFNPAMMSYNDKKGYYKVNRENIHTFKKPDPKLAEKWMQKLSRHQIDVVESVAGDLLSKLEYKLQGNPISVGALERLYYRLHQAVIGEIQIQYRWRRFRVKEFLAKKS